MARQILYAMQFKSQAVPADDAGTIFKATTTAPSCTMTTVVGANGFSANLQPTRVASHFHRRDVFPRSGHDLSGDPQLQYPEGRSRGGAVC